MDDRTRTVVTEALYAADDAAADAYQTDRLSFSGEAAVIAFLRHMNEHYGGDMYIEGALGHLCQMVEEVTQSV